jgi:hypothetical protein
MIRAMFRSRIICPLESGGRAIIVNSGGGGPGGVSGGPGGPCELLIVFVAQVLRGIPGTAMCGSVMMSWNFGNGRKKILYIMTMIWTFGDVDKVIFRFMSRETYVRPLVPRPVGLDL